MTPDISVIIPTENEAQNLPRTLASLRGNECPFEVVVVDASADGVTAETAFDRGCRVIRSPRPSRAAQMNLGTAQALAPIYLFLHADTRVPAGGLDRIVVSLRDSPDIVGGAFRRRFDSRSLFLKFSTGLASLRSRHLGLFLGDQGIFVRGTVFEAIGGFDESLEQCEDLDFSRRLKAQGRTIALGPPVVSSARRFAARGPVRTTLADIRQARGYYRRRRS